MTPPSLSLCLLYYYFCVGVEMSRSMQAQVLSIFGPDGTTTKERKELTVVIKVKRSSRWRARERGKARPGYPEDGDD